MKNQEIAVRKSTVSTGNEKLFNFRPIFFAAIFLCFGIVFAYFHLFYQLSFWWLLLSVPMLILPFFLCKNSADKGSMKKIALSVGTLAISFIIGFGVFTYAVKDYAACTAYDGEYTVSGTVVEKTEYDYSVKLVLQDIYIGKNKEKGRLNAYLPLSFAENIHIADEVLLQGYVKTETAYFNDYGFRETDIGAGVRFVLENVGDCMVVGKTNNLFLRMQRRLEKTLFSGMDGTSAAVTLAVLLGNTSLIEDGLLDNVRMGGVAHIFAVSGLHIGALYGFCLWLTEKTKLRSITKPIRFLLVAALLCLYAGICGFSSSVMRAMTLCLVAYAAKLIGTESDILQSTGLAAIFVLLLKPTELFAVGFQLSFAACLGIGLFARPLRLAFEGIYERGKMLIGKWLRVHERARANPESRLSGAPLGVGERMVRAGISFASVSLAAQITTAPILLYAFDYLSLAGLLLNGIFVPFISGIFSVLLLFAVAASLLPAAATSVVLYLPSVVWSAALLLFEGVDFSSFALTGWKISIGGSICYYFGWLFLTDKWNLPKIYKMLFSVACFLAFGITMYALNG